MMHFAFRMTGEVPDPIEGGGFDPLENADLTASCGVECLAAGVASSDLPRPRVWVSPRDAIGTVRSRMGASTPQSRGRGVDSQIIWVESPRSGSVPTGSQRRLPGGLEGMR